MSIGSRNLYPSDRRGYRSVSEQYARQLHRTALAKIRKYFNHPPHVRCRMNTTTFEQQIDAEIRTFPAVGTCYQPDPMPRRLGLLRARSHERYRGYGTDSAVHLGDGIP